MGRLSRFFFEQPEETVQETQIEVLTEAIEVDVNTENVGQDNLIEDIYSQNDLADTSKSIFKVEELINSLPKEMPNETKKTTVLSMLSIFGLTVDEVVQDGKGRVAIVSLANDEIVDDNAGIIANNNALIEQKKLEIQELEKDNALRSSYIKETHEKVETELNRINGLIKFVGGEV